MILTLTNTKKNTFMKINGDPTIYKEDMEGNKVPSGTYRSNTIPGTFAIKKIKWNATKRKYDLDIDPKLLDELVKDMGFFSKNGDAIVTANIRNQMDPFFAHNDLFFKIENGANSIDDSTAFGRLQAIWMKQQPEYEFKGEASNPALNALRNYTISTTAIDNEVEAKIIDKTIEAIELLNAMTYDIQCSLLKAMGVAVRGAEPSIVKATLFRKVTDDKNLVPQGSSKNNIDLFLELAREESSVINLKGIVTMAKEYGMVAKSKNGFYRYGEIDLGRTIGEVNTFLSNKENFDIVNRITDELRTKGVEV
jgi:hypothetical protein